MDRYRSITHAQDLSFSSTWLSSIMQELMGKFDHLMDRWCHHNRLKEKWWSIHKFFITSRIYTQFELFILYHHIEHLNILCCLIFWISGDFSEVGPIRKKDYVIKMRYLGHGNLIWMRFWPIFLIFFCGCFVIDLSQFRGCKKNMNNTCASKHVFCEYIACFDQEYASTLTNYQRCSQFFY